MRAALGHWLYGLSVRRHDRRGGAAALPPPERPARPAGCVIWIDSSAASETPGLVALARRLRRDRPGCTVLMTSGSGAPPELELPGVIQQTCGPDTPEAARDFLGHWTPDLGIVLGNGLRPVLLRAAARRSVPLILAEARMPRVTVAGRRGWWPGVAAAALRRFRHVLAADTDALRACRRAGAPRGTLRLLGRIEEPSHALPCNEAERDALARGFGTRPVWLAVAAPASEDAILAEAHHAALRMAHRLLLVVVPDQPGRGAALAELLTGQHGLACARRAAEQDPDDDTQVYVADTEGELGLWYRLAPATYIGGTLAGPAAGRHPFEPAALGSAVLHGPRTAPFTEAHGRLRAAGGSRLLGSPAELAEQVGDLLTPDRAARLARAAWDVISAGAEATDKLMALVGETLDKPVAPRRVAGGKREAQARDATI